MERRESRRDEAMIDLSGMISIALLKKEVFCGSEKGMRFRLAKVSNEENEDVLEAVIWPEPFNYATTEEEKKEREQFPFTKEGIGQAVDWMNQKHDSEPERWKKKRIIQA